MKKISGQVMEIYHDLDVHISRFSESSGYKCQHLCIACCDTTEAHASLGECLPFAFEAVINRPELIDRFESLSDEELSGRPCVFYNTNLTLYDRGGCTIYGVRPLMCRLFGYSAIMNKHLKCIFAACKWMKDSSPDMIQKTQEAIDNGLSVPIMPDYAFRVFHLAPYLGSEEFPINVAMKKAIEKVKVDLEIFGRRLKKINLNENLNIKDIDSLLIFENPNNELKTNA